jgi:LPPG:FO 2-phospho-L-lactate transferase
MITVLTGGTGGAKFVEGLSKIVPHQELTCIVNTSDDLIWWGLYVSPDVDSITYVLSGLLNPDRGWGIADDTFQCRGAIGRLGGPTWFSLGDRDLATHLTRTQLMQSGQTHSQITADICRRLGIAARILPMSDQRVETRVLTNVGELGFQDYFVRRWFQDPVESVRFAGIDAATPAPGVLEAIQDASQILLAPSNPVTSIGPILAMPGIRDALRKAKASIAAVSPILGGAAVSGPAGALMQAVGLPVSVEGVAQAYCDFLDLLIVDETDSAAAAAFQHPSLRMACTKSILMKTSEQRIALAKAALQMISDLKPTPIPNAQEMK